MKSILKLYGAFLRQSLPQESLDDLYRTVDRETAARLMEKGYGREAAKGAIYALCPYAARLERGALEAFFAEILPPGMKEGGRADSRAMADMQGIYREAKRAHAGEFELLCFSHDTEAISKLHDMGFSPISIYEAYQGSSLYAAEMQDDAMAAAYEDRVRRAVAEDREAEAQLQMEPAMRDYRAQAEARQHKFADGGREYGLYRDGEAALSLLAGGYLPETVREVLRPHAESRDYLEKLMEACGQVKLAYIDIRQAPSIEEAASVADTYRAFAKSYMLRSGLKQLSFEGERQVIREMKEAGYPAPFIQKGLLAASPVAREPGRDSAQYADALLADVPDLDKALSKAMSRETFVQAGDIYKNFIYRQDKELKQKGNPSGITPEWRPYYDCLAVRKLIAGYIPERDIQETLRENSPNGEEIRDNYGYWMLEKARRILKREQELLHRSAPKLPPKKTFAELMALGFAPVALYQSVLREKLALAPSLSGRLFEEAFDKDMAEGCLVRWPDFDTGALQGLIAESPRAALLADTGLPEEKNYAAGVLKEAQARMKESRDTRQKEQSLLFEFNRQRGLAYQGVEAKDADPAYQCGRSALQLMLMGYDPLAIRGTILQDISPQALGVPAETFADRIIERTREVHARLMAVKSWQAQEGEEKGAGEAYMRLLHEKYLARKSVRPSMDIEIIRTLLLEGRRRQDILEAVKAHSPMAIEPGRDDTYVTEYLLPQAQNEIVAAKDRLMEDAPQPREAHAEDALEEYAFQREAIKARHPLLPYSMQMDELAAAALLMEGFFAVDVARALDAASPCREEQQNYGAAMAARVQRTYMEEHYHTESETETRNVAIVRQRALNPSTGNIETSTETATDTAATV